jgi:hypothetical protein
MIGAGSAAQLVRNERGRCVRAGIMDAAGEQLFARPRLSGQQSGLDWTGRNSGRHADRLLDRRTLALEGLESGLALASELRRSLHVETGLA